MSWRVRRVGRAGGIGWIMPALCCARGGAPRPACRRACLCVAPGGWGWGARLCVALGFIRRVCLVEGSEGMEALLQLLPGTSHHTIPGRELGAPQTADEAPGGGWERPARPVQLTYDSRPEGSTSTSTSTRAKPLAHRATGLTVCGGIGWLNRMRRRALCVHQIYRSVQYPRIGIGANVPNRFGGFARRCSW